MGGLLFPHLYRCGHIEAKSRTGIFRGIFSDFRIFIDAATLKDAFFCQRCLSRASRFPHLYRCGHIEGTTATLADGAMLCNFRIFIDAATLKEKTRQTSIWRVYDFRIFIDAATLKGAQIREIDDGVARFPHLYRCGHIEGRAQMPFLGRPATPISASL